MERKCRNSDVISIRSDKEGNLVKYPDGNMVVKCENCGEIQGSHQQEKMLHEVEWNSWEKK